MKILWNSSQHNFDSMVTRKLIKLFNRFKTKEDRRTIEEIMAVFLPILHSRCASWVKDDSLDSYLLVTKVFKIFRALIQVYNYIILTNMLNMSF